MTAPLQRRGHQAKVNAMSFALLVEAMLEGNHTIAELSEITGLHRVTIQRYTATMHKYGAVHIASWEKDKLGRDCHKVYKIGKGKDAKRERMTQAERQARHRRKKDALKLVNLWNDRSANQNLQKAA